MARCPAKNTLGPNSACNSVERKHIEYMGFTVRDDRWRYTAWLKFDGVKNAALWSTIDNDDDHRYRHEYAHHRKQQQMRE